MWELETTTAYWIGMATRTVWIAFAAYYSLRSYQEFRTNRDAYRNESALADGRRIVRRRRYQRSHGMFWGFFFALLAGAMGWASFLFYTPRVETNVTNIVVSAVTLAMLAAFSRGKEADLRMREDALEYRKRHPPKNAMDRSVGQEIAEGPEEEEEERDL